MLGVGVEEEGTGGGFILLGIAGEYLGGLIGPLELAGGTDDRIIPGGGGNVLKGDEAGELKGDGSLEYISAAPCVIEAVATGDGAAGAPPTTVARP
jgi:hypothetical protein